jgi:nitrogen-specific signal transduction histidine kinase
VTIDIQLIGAIGLCIAVTALALFVMLHNPTARVNRRFGVMAFVTGGWILAISLALAAGDPATTVGLGRIGFAFASAIPVTLIWMVDSLSDARTWTHRLRRLIPGCLCVVFVALSLGPWIVSGANPGVPRANFLYGPAHRWFGIYFLLVFATGIYTLWKTSSHASGTTRVQLLYLLLGISLTGAGAISTNLIIPVVWKTSQYSLLGPYFSLLFFSFSAHAIIRHRLMDIRVFIRKSAVYVAAIVASAAIFALVAQPITRAAGYQHGDGVHPGTALVIALALAIAFQPLKSQIQRYMNRYVYRESYDYQRTLRDVTKSLSTILDLQSLLQYLTATIENTLKVETVLVYIWDPSRRAFVPRSPDHNRPPGLSSAPELAETSALLTFLRMEQRCLVREEANIEAAPALVKTAAQELTDLRGEIAFPLVNDANVTGLILFGAKRSGDPYFTEDIDLLSILTSQAAVAMQNAQLYRQVVLANEYLDNILSTMESGVIAVDATGRVSRVNPAAERLTGLDSDKLRTAPYVDLPTMLAIPLRETLEDGKARPQFETSIEGPMGFLPLVCSTATLRTKDGATEGALIVFSDLTRVKDLEREKQTAERLAAFGALAAGVAHEIKNPLVAIRTFAELLPERFADTDFRDDFSKVVVREIDRIDNLVARLRGIATAPQQQIGSIDVRQPLSETLKLLRGQLEQTRTTVHTTIEDSAPLVTMDDAQLKQLFLNLFQNSIEAMGYDGDLSIRIARRHSGGSTLIAIEISDTGPGISDSIRGHIFEPFFTTKSTGSGLGLAICRSIVDAHRGSIRAQNNPDRSGTTVIVELPATDGAALALQASAVRG